MIESELKQYLNKHYPQENESCEWKEFKSLKHSFTGSAGNDMISYISAIANMEGGHLVIGVEDSTLNIVGIEDFNNHTPQNIKLRILEKCTDLNSDQLNIEEFITKDTNKTIWIIHIPKHLSRRPIYAHSKAWQRVEDSLVEMRPERKESILREPLSVSEDWSAKIIPSSSINDLDPLAIEKARLEYKKKNNKKAAECDTWDDETFLNKAKITIKGQITNTAILLLGKEESAHLLLPAILKISWIIKDEHNIEKDYEHFGTPLLLNTDEVFGKIRNLTYRYMQDSTLFPTEIKTYEPYVIREALHNCIAHQDYSLKGRISVVEKPEELIFSSLGSFLPGSIEKVIEQDSPQEYYRNAFLAEAMVSLNMIDTIGSGIKRMFLEQKKRFFPLPDYDLSDLNKVVVRISGRIWDVNYTKLLMKRTDIDLKTVILLDKVQKKNSITDNEARILRKQKLIEGRKPNYYLSFEMAEKTESGTDYVKQRGFKDKYYKDLVLEYIEKKKFASKVELDKLLIDILPSVLSDKQKANKIRNIIYAMSKKEQTIINTGTNRYPKWKINNK
jgi:ATP-dependent DNA helicase RecG